MAKIQTNSKLWKFVGGCLCLDFVNTVGGRADSGTVLRDKLTSFEDLLEWSKLGETTNRAKSAELARHAASHPEDAETTLERAVRLREALYKILQSTLKGRRPRPADLDTLSAELQAARAHQHLAPTGRAFSWTFEDSEPALDRILWPVSLSAAEVLTSGDLSRLRQCGGSECGWMFLDTSRNRSRQWCDMKDCGNRAKVRRFRKRQQRSHRPRRSDR
jgi:predicted RNA-binding Zn ribbon-like protein